MNGVDREQQSLTRGKNKAYIGTNSFIVTFITKSTAVTFYLQFEPQGLDVVRFRVLTIPVPGEKELEFWPPVSILKVTVTSKMREYREEGPQNSHGGGAS